MPRIHMDHILKLIEMTASGRDTVTSYISLAIYIGHCFFLFKPL